MFSSMGRRAIASIVGFFLGWAVFAIVRPVSELPSVDMPSLEISSITLKHQGCSDAELKCAVYDVTFSNDGTATYVGYANDEFIGKYTAYFAQQDFKYLTEQLHAQRFFELPQPSAFVPVEEDVVLEVVTNEGVHRLTSHNWHSTPCELRALQALIDEQVYHVEEWIELRISRD